LINLGRPQEAPELARKAIELSPRDPSIGIFYWVIGRAYFFTTRYEDAIPWLERSIEVRPNISFNRLYLAASYVLTGRVEKGRATLAEFNNQFPGYTLALIDLHNEDVPTDNPIILAGLQQWRLGLQGAGMPEH
jgi:tetratricopeptide (TPR) repeat protein